MNPDRYFYGVLLAVNFGVTEVTGDTLVNNDGLTVAVGGTIVALVVGRELVVMVVVGLMVV